MPIASIISGLTALAGSGMAVAKMIRDDKQSRYPPEYLMYKDMMKDARKYGYPPMGMMMQQPFIAPMAQPPQPIMVQPDLVGQILQEYQKQQLSQMIANMVTQAIQKRLSQPQQMYAPRRPDYGYQPQPVQPISYGYQPRVPPPLPNLQYYAEPMWETPADGVAVQTPPPEPSPYQLALVPKPIPMPQPQPQPYVAPIPPPPQPPSVKFCQPEQFVQQPQPQSPPLVMPGNGNMYQSQLSWESSNAFNVDQNGLQSFISHCDNRPKIPDNYVGNTLDVW